MRLLLLVAFAGGCTNVDTRPCLLNPANNATTETNPVEKQAITVEFPIGLLRSPNCPDLMVQSVNGTVLDPDNRPMPSVTTLTSPHLDQARALVTFTPPRPGPYHVTVRFDPEFGTHQLDLQVAVDRRDAGSHSVQLAGADIHGCGAFDVAGDVALCHRPSNQSLIACFADGEPTTSVSAKQFSVDGVGRVWTLDNGGVNAQMHVFGFDGGAFVELATNTPSGSQPLALVARGNDAVVLRTDQVEFWHYDAGQLTLETVAPLPVMNSQQASSWCLSYAPPSHLIAVDAAHFEPPLKVIGANATFLDAPSMEFGTGADDDGIWWTDTSNIFVDVDKPVIDAGITVSTVGAILYTNACPESQQSPIVQDVQGRQTVPRLIAGSILMEKFPDDHGPLLGANSRLVWGIDGGTLYWFDRPTLP